MAKKASSSRWRRRQDTDPYVARAQSEGWRSRAVFKLIEIQERERLLRPGSAVVDLGAAPGGWSQYAAGQVGDRGKVIAVDLLPMDAIAGVHFIQGDFHDENTLQQVMEAAAGKVNVVLSDMAPNISGTRSVDQPKAMALAELAVDLAEKLLKPGGSLVIKLFHGEGFDAFVRDTRRHFEALKVRKPAASRPESRETYLVARTFRL